MTTRMVPRNGSLPAAAKLAASLMFMVALGAIPTGWAMVTTAPGDAPLGMSVAWLKDSPFTTYFIPGLLLFALFGLGSLAAVALGLLRHRLAPFATFAVGVGLVIWIAVQSVMMRAVGMHPLQPTMFVFGFVIALSAYIWWRAAR